MSDKTSDRAIRKKADAFEVANRLWDRGLTYREIAYQTGMTIAQVKAKVRGRPRETSNRMTEAESYEYDLCDEHAWAGIGDCPECFPPSPSKDAIR